MNNETSNNLESQTDATTAPLSSTDVQDKAAAVPSGGGSGAVEPVAPASSAPIEPTSPAPSGAAVSESAKTIPLDTDAVNAQSASASENASASQNTSEGSAKSKPTFRKASSASGSISTNLGDKNKASSTASASTSQSTATAQKESDKKKADGKSALRDSAPLRAEPRRERDMREASVDERKKRFRKERHARAIKRTIIVVVLALIIGTIGGFCTIHWFVYNDAESIQGTWRIEDTDTVFTITDTTITLTEGVAYEYVIDSEGKMIAFTFGGLEGHARYRFSLDHNELCVQDGSYDWVGTLFADIPWTFEAAVQYLTGGGQKSPSFGNGSMVLSRVTQ